MILPRIRRNVPESLGEPLDSLRRDVARLLAGWPEGQGEAGLASYPVDVFEEEEKVHVEAEMPGFRREDIDVSIEQTTLHLVAERTPSEPAGRRHLHERRFTRVERSISLPCGVKEEGVSARFQDGVLYVTLEKSSEGKARRIPIE
jgi:HSP20 family protein